MTRTPMMVGPTMADAVVWNWNPVGRRWRAELPDGTVLEAVYHKTGGRNSKATGRSAGYWLASAGDLMASTIRQGAVQYTKREDAQRAAVEAYKTWVIKEG